MNLGTQILRPQHPRSVRRVTSLPKATSFSTNLGQHTFTETPWVTSEQMSGHHGPAKSTHKINCHNFYSSSGCFYFLILWLNPQHM